MLESLGLLPVVVGCLFEWFFGVPWLASATTVELNIPLHAGRSTFFIHQMSTTVEPRRMTKLNVFFSVVDGVTGPGCQHAAFLN